MSNTNEHRVWCVATNKFYVKCNKFFLFVWDYAQDEHLHQQFQFNTSAVTMP
jgi:hypothetical protein